MSKKNDSNPKAEVEPVATEIEVPESAEMVKSSSDVGYTMGTVGAMFEAKRDGTVVTQNPLDPMSVGGPDVNPSEITAFAAGSSKQVSIADAASPWDRNEIRDDYKEESKGLPIVGVGVECAKFDPADVTTAKRDLNKNVEFLGASPGTTISMDKPHGRTAMSETIGELIAVEGLFNERSPAMPTYAAVTHGNDTVQVAYNQVLPSYAQIEVRDATLAGKLNINPNYPFIHMDDVVAAFKRGDITKTELLSLSDNKLNGNEVVAVRPSNYLVRSMDVKVNRFGHVIDVDFDVEELPIDVDVLDYVDDHARIMYNRNNRIAVDVAAKIREKGDDFYTPIGDGIDNPDQHITLLKAIAAADAALAYNVSKSMLEAHAINRHRLSMMGLHRGSVAAAGYATSLRHAGGYCVNAIERMSEHGRWKENECQVVNGVPRFTNTDGVIDDSLGAYIYAMDPSAYKKASDGLFGLYKTRPLGQSLAALQYAFDACGFKTTAEAKKYIDQLGYFMDDKRKMIVGRHQLGIILPFNPKTYFTYHDSSALYWQETLVGKCIVSSIANEGALNRCFVGSKLFQAIIDYFNIEFSAKIVQNWVTHSGGHYYIAGVQVDDASQDGAVFRIDFTPRADKLTMSQMIFANALKYYGNNKIVNQAYDEYAVDYGQDLSTDDHMVNVTIADCQSGCFTGVNSKPAFKPVSDALRFRISHPRHFSLAAGCNVKVGVADHESVASVYYLPEMYSHDYVDSLDVTFEPVYQLGFRKHRDITENANMERIKRDANLPYPIASRFAATHFAGDEPDVINSAEVIRNNTYHPAWAASRDEVVYLPMEGASISSDDYDASLGADKESVWQWTVAKELSMPDFMGYALPNVRNVADAAPGFLTTLVGYVKMDVEAVITETGADDHNEVVIASAPLEDYEVMFAYQEIPYTANQGTTATPDAIHCRDIVIVDSASQALPSSSAPVPYAAAWNDYHVVLDPSLVPATVAGDSDGLLTVDVTEAIKYDYFEDVQMNPVTPYTATRYRSVKPTRYANNDWRAKAPFTNEVLNLMVGKMGLLGFQAIHWDREMESRRDMLYGASNDVTVPEYLNKFAL